MSSWKLVRDVEQERLHREALAHHYREWLRHNTVLAAQFHHQTLGHLEQLSHAEQLAAANLPPPRQYLWVDNRLVIIDTERWQNFWCLI